MPRVTWAIATVFPEMTTDSMSVVDQSVIP